MPVLQQFYMLHLPEGYEYFDFGGDYCQRGAEIYGRIVKSRHVRSKPVNIWLATSSALVN